MIFKILKKIIGLFGFKLISKNLIKNNRILDNFDSLSLDKILENLFNKNKIHSLIQVGANDGLRFDNINKYIKNYKPKAILVEPINEYFEQLKINYKSYDNVFFENLAITVNDEINYLFKVKSEYLNNYDEHIKGISSFDKKHLKKHGVKNSHIIKEKINSLSIIDLFNKYNFKIDLLIIDAEGYDAEIVLDLLKNSNFKPLIIFEYIHVKTNSLKELTTILSQKNFNILRINENIICTPNEINLEIDI